MQAAQSSAGVWGDIGGALVWGPLTAVLTLGGPGSEVIIIMLYLQPHTYNNVYM